MANDPEYDPGELDKDRTVIVHDPASESVRPEQFSDTIENGAPSAGIASIVKLPEPAFEMVTIRSAELPSSG